ncbi:hypothetical protein V8E53_004033 [Lactarius tabidus]
MVPIETNPLEPIFSPQKPQLSAYPLSSPSRCHPTRLYIHLYIQSQLSTFIAARLHLLFHVLRLRVHPADPVRFPRVLIDNTVSPSSATTRHIKASTSSLSLAGPSNPIHREPVRTATSVLCKET